MKLKNALACSSYHNETTQMRWQKKNVFLTVQDARKFKTKVLTIALLGESSVPHLQMIAFRTCLHKDFTWSMGNPCVSV